MDRMGFGGANNWDEEQVAMNNYAIKAFSALPMAGGRRVRYNPCDFEGRRGVRVIFRKLVDGENEHWLNELACWLTSPIMPPYNKAPFNNNCHSEIVMDIAPGCTVRIGTMYKQGVEKLDEDGQPVIGDNGKPVIDWKPGQARGGGQALPQTPSQERCAPSRGVGYERSSFLREALLGGVWERACPPLGKTLVT